MQRTLSPTWRSPLKLIMASLFATMMAVFSGSKAEAAASVNWLTPPDGSSYLVGTPVAPTGNANATGTTGTGLDLVLVLDSSGSMGGTAGTTQTLQQWQRDASIALVNSLPEDTTSVSIVEFDSDANVVIGLTPLIPASNKTDIINAINGVNASGGTNIPSGINAGTGVLTGGGATAGRASQMVVLSDGFTSGDPGAAAAAAIAAGVDNVHSVALPNANVTQMQSIATNGNGTFVDFSSATDLQPLIDIFNGTGGNFVGIDKVEVTLPDGTVVEVPVDAFGNFQVSPDWGIELGPNTFIATAFADDGTTDTATLTLIGTAGIVPLPAAAWMLLSGLIGLGAVARRKSAA